jgi:hypothetical protein
MKNVIMFLVLVLLSFHGMLRGQEFSRFEPDQFDPELNYGSFNYVHLSYFKGDHLTYPRELTEMFTKGYDAVEARVGWQSTGRQLWQRMHKYPVYGLGVFLSSLGDSDIDSIVGAPSALYFFYGEPWARFGKFTLMTDLAIGLSYDFVPYDLEDNPVNDVIGSRVNLYFNLNAQVLYRIDENLDMSFGYNLLHFSNGRTNTPQRGINLGGLNLGLKYNFNPVVNYTRYVRPDYVPPRRPEFQKGGIPEVKRFGEIQFTLSGGTVLTEPGEFKDEQGVRDSTGIQARYYTSTVSLEYAYLVAHRVKLHAGLDGFYDGSLENFIDGKAPQEVDLAGKVMLGSHIGLQYRIERFAFYYALGAYLYKETSTRGKWYMRAGGRIGLTDDLDVHVALKTRNGGIADWIEWGLAYKIRVH